MIKAVTWGWNSQRGDYQTKSAEESLDLLMDRINLSHVIIAFGAVQDTAFSTNINFQGKHTPSIEEIRYIIRKIHARGKKVILKPVVNCLDGTWRAHINFFDLDVPCEPKWSEWFESYNKYILEFARLAQEEGCDIFVIGCEMVQTDRREKEWRNLISLVREVYKGKISYNCDKYQEGNVKWWDAVDIISSSGYYPLGTWEENLERIRKAIISFEKDFIFMEVGCPSKEANGLLPNKWDMENIPNMEEQEKFYVEMFEESRKRSFVKGFGLWDWDVKLYKEKNAKKDCGYNFYGKPAEKIVNEYFSKE